MQLALTVLQKGQDYRRNFNYIDINLNEIEICRSKQLSIL